MYYATKLMGTNTIVCVLCKLHVLYTLKNVINFPLQCVLPQERLKVAIGCAKLLKLVL
jgi:hypothetical protein